MAEEEVRTSIVLEDEATEVIGKIAEALKKLESQKEHVEHKAHEGGGEGMFGALVSEHAVESLKEKLAEVPEFFVEKFKEASEFVKEQLGEAIHAGVEGMSQTKNIASVLGMADRTGESFTSLTGKARIFHEEFAELGATAGVSEQEISEGFNSIFERSNKSALEVQELTEKMAYAGRVIPGGAGALAQGFQMMEMGIVRARNPLVQLIASTGVMHGTARSVAAQLQKMTPEKQMELAEKAIEKMGEKAKNMKPTWEELNKSFGMMREQAYEALGTPLVKSIIPKLAEIRESMLEHREDIMFALTDAGEFLGQQGDRLWATFKTAVTDMSKKEEDIETTHKALTAGLKAGFELYVTSWQTVIENGEKFLEKIVSAFAQVINLVKKVRDEVENVIAGQNMGRVSNAAKTDINKREMSRIMSGITPGAQRGDVEAALGKAHWAIGTTEADIKRYTDILMEAQKKVQDGTNLFQTTADKVNPEAFNEAYSRAAENHQDAMADFAVKTLLGSDKLQDALLKAGDHLDVAWDQIIERAKRMHLSAGDIAALEKKIKGGIGEGRGPLINIQTVHINQDLRGEDPDRVVAVMQRDLVKASVSRTQSMLSPAFSF